MLSALAGLGGILLNVLWQGALVGLAGGLALRLVGPVASRVRYRLALAALMLVALAPLATVTRRAGVLADWGVVTRVSESRQATTPAVPTSLPVTRNLPSGSRREPRSAPVAPRNQVLSWLGALWLVGALALLARLAHGLHQVHRIRKASRLVASSRGVSILLSERADVPFASGVHRPAVLLPKALADELSPDQVRAVLAHELAHIRRHDYAVNLWQRVLEALLWFHPAVHWLSRVAREEREHCCDELAALVVGDRCAVAGALLALEEARGALVTHSLVPAAAGGPLLRRVERLLTSLPVPRSSRWAIAAVAVLCSSAGTLLLVTPARSAVVTPPTSRALENAGPIVWTGTLRPGERLRVRNLVGSIRVVRAAGATGVVRAHQLGTPLTDLAFPVTVADDGVTLCAVRAAFGRCDPEGSTWFGSATELHRARIELTVELPAGVGVTAATFEGDLELDRIDADAEARTGLGSIAARIIEPRGRDSDRTIELHTGGGPVQVALPREFGGVLDARLSRGQIDAAPPLRSPTQPSPGVTRVSLGKGRNRLRVSSGNGDLILTRS